MSQQYGFDGQMHNAEVRIAGNPLLESLCNRIMELVERQPELLNGDEVGKIDRRVTICLWLDSGLRQILPDVDQRGKVTDWLQSKACIDEEAVSRARRYLESHDMIRLSAAAVRNAEQHRERIARSVKS